LSKIQHPQRFSDVFGVPPSTLKRRGAFDPILNADTLLFIDPLLLASSAHAEMRQARLTWEQHFEKLIKLLTHAKDPTDPAWRAADTLLKFQEFRGTCLGYGSGSIRGTGLPRPTRDGILRTAHRIVELGIRDPELFSLIPLIEDGVGPDSISDMTSHVIAPELAEFTVRVLKGLPITTQEFHIGNKQIELPVNPLRAPDEPPSQ
jgi:hypothetical protein